MCQPSCKTKLGSNGFGNAFTNCGCVAGSSGVLLPAPGFPATAEIGNNPIIADRKTQAVIRFGECEKCFIIVFIN